MNIQAEFRVEVYVRSSQHDGVTKEELAQLLRKYKSKIEEMLLDDNRLHLVAVTGTWEATHD